MPPSIVTVNGTLSHGGSLTIDGSGFGTKNPAKPVIWAPFDGQSSVIEDSAHSTGSLLNQFCSLTTANQKPNSTHAVRGFPNASPGGKQNVRLYTNIGGNPASKVYHHVHRWWGADFFTPGGDVIKNHKILRHWPNCSNGYKNFVVTVGDIGAGGPPGGFLATSEGDGGPTRVTSFKGIGGADNPPTESWVREESELYHGTLNISNAQFRYWLNGTLLLNWTHIGADSGDPDLDWGCLGVENFWSQSPSPPVNVYAYFDDLYLDRTWARVMIADTNDWNGAQHREPQIPTAWTSGQIQVQVNRGGFASLNDKYLFVVDSDGTVSAPFALSGLGPDTTPPTAPTGLMVS